MNLREILTAPHNWDLFDYNPPISDPTEHLRFESESHEGGQYGDAVCVSSPVNIENTRIIKHWVERQQLGRWRMIDGPMWSDKLGRFLYVFVKGKETNEKSG